MTATTNVDLSDEQMAAAESLLSQVDHRQVQTLGGYAGTGKTTVVRHLHSTLPDYAVCAYTGKAADVLRRKGIDANTIHGTIYRPVETGRGVDFRLKSAAEVGCRGFIVDEASMVGSDIFADLRGYGLPIIAVGDHGQLPPVGEDAGLMRNPDVRLETIHRNAGPIARFAEHLRTGYGAADWPHPNGGGVWVVAGSAAPAARLAGSDQIICAFNRTRVGLNRTVRAHLGLAGAGCDPNAPEVGDRVMCLRNERAVGVFNGQQGRIVEIDRRERTILFAPTFGRPVTVEYHPAAWNAEKTPERDRSHPPGSSVPFDFAYAITAHKSQGDEWGNVIVYEERCKLWEHARWAYTAASRAKNALVWVAD